MQIYMAATAGLSKGDSKEGICMPTNLERINNAVKIAIGPWSFS
jgi:hypothetical protein